jgi:gluconolactonase
MGHNTDFVTIIAFNILNILTENQRSALIALAKTQVSQINEYGYKRFPLMKAFRRLISGDLPTGCTGLDRSAVMAHSAELYQLDGQISYDRAKTLGSIIRGMTSQQRARMDALKALNGVGNWNKTLPDPLKGMNLDHDVNVAVMTYASEMYSWYAGSVEADTYFCPERQGTYFESFYMKDAPAMAAGPGFTIPSNLTADMGSNFLSSLTTDQAGSVIDLVNIQRNDLNEIVATRRSISTQLRRFITESSVDSTTVLNLARRYGELDGEIVYNYATHFVQVSKTLSSNQEAQLMALRETWNTIPCSGAYLYSAKINMPEIMNTDFLFGASGGNGVTAGSIVKIADGFTFAEGPAADAAGNIFFSDVTANKIYKWSTGGQLSVFLENSGGANGLLFDGQCNLLACQGANGRVVSIDSQGKVSVLAEKYNGMRFNEPNDLWIDPKGGVYFSDPLYFGKIRYQNGEHVYYLTPNRDNIIQVVNDLVRPNGIIGTPDGKTLYVADHGAGKIYRYSIAQNGSLTDKTLFASSGSDGMTIDDQGNIYLTTGTTVLVYSSSGSLIETINVPLQPTNVCFGGSDGKTLFITTKTALYALPMKVKGVSYSSRGTAADELVLNSGPTCGLYHYDQAGGWKQWNTVSPSQMVTADLNGDAGDELIAAFPGYGLYTYDSANGWQLINRMIPEGMITYRNGIVCDYGAGYGLWHWTQAGGWKQQNTADPGLMTAVDIDKDGVDEIAIAFPGYGLYTYDPPNHWTRINTIIPENMISLNNGIACDYGAGHGLWYWTQASGWKKWNIADPGQMVATDVNNDGVDELVVSFPGYGLYYHDEIDAWHFLNDVVPGDMKPINFYP